jgi:hypothetical protein
VTRRREAALEEIRGGGWRDEIESLDPAQAPGVLTHLNARARTQRFPDTGCPVTTGSGIGSMKRSAMTWAATQGSGLSRQI